MPGKCTLITHLGRTQSLSKWAKELRLCVRTVQQRIKLGWTPEDALTTKPRRGLMYEYKGHVMTLTGWSKRTGIRRQTLEGRVERGWDFADAVEGKVRRWGR